MNPANNYPISSFTITSTSTTPKKESQKTDKQNGIDITDQISGKVTAPYKRDLENVFQTASKGLTQFSRLTGGVQNLISQNATSGQNAAHTAQAFSNSWKALRNDQDNNRQRMTALTDRIANTSFAFSAVTANRPVSKSKQCESQWFRTEMQDQIREGQNVVNALSLPIRAVGKGIELACNHSETDKAICGAIGNTIKDIGTSVMQIPGATSVIDRLAEGAERLKKENEKYGIPQKQTEYFLDSAGMLTIAVATNGVGRVITNNVGGIIKGVTIKEGQIIGQTASLATHTMIKNNMLMNTDTKPNVTTSRKKNGSENRELPLNADQILGGVSIATVASTTKGFGSKGMGPNSTNKSLRTFSQTSGKTFPSKGLMSPDSVPQTTGRGIAKALPPTVLPPILGSKSNVATTFSVEERIIHGFNQFKDFGNWFTEEEVWLKAASQTCHCPKDLYSMKITIISDGYACTIANLGDRFIVKDASRSYMNLVSDESIGLRYLSGERLKHLRVPVVFLNGTYNGESRFFLIKEYIPGRTLKEMLSLTGNTVSGSRAHQALMNECILASNKAGKALGEFHSRFRSHLEAEKFYKELTIGLLEDKLAETNRYLTDLSGSLRIREGRGFKSIVRAFQQSPGYLSRGLVGDLDLSNFVWGKRKLTLIDGEGVSKRLVSPIREFHDFRSELAIKGYPSGMTREEISRLQNAFDTGYVHQFGESRTYKEALRLFDAHSSIDTAGSLAVDILEGVNVNREILVDLVEKLNSALK